MRRESRALPRAAVTMFFVAVAFAIAAVTSCYDHLHPPTTPGGNPADVPPLTDSKAMDAG